MWLAVYLYPDPRGHWTGGFGLPTVSLRELPFKPARWNGRGKWAAKVGFIFEVEAVERVEGFHPKPP
jgi:hypothetical protein